MGIIQSVFLDHKEIKIEIKSNLKQTNYTSTHVFIELRIYKNKKYDTMYLAISQVEFTL